MLLIEYIGHIGLMSLTGGHLGHHLEYFRTFNDARVASVGFIKYNASTTRINKEKNNFKIKFQVILVFYRTKLYSLKLRIISQLLILTFVFDVQRKALFRQFFTHNTASMIRNYDNHTLQPMGKSHRKGTAIKYQQDN